MSMDERTDGRADDLASEVDGVGTHHLDTPLTATLPLSELRRRPTRAEVETLLRDAAAGRHGRGWKRAVTQRTISPRAAALLAATVIGGVFLIAVLVSVVQGDGDDALLGLGISAVLTAVGAALAAWGAAAARRRRWRRHARFATFARAAGMHLRLFAHTETVPRAIRRRPKEHGITRDAVHADVMSARIGGYQLLAGTRTTDVKRGDDTTTYHLHWAGLRALDGEVATPLFEADPRWIGLRSWCEQEAGRHPVRLWLADGWLLLGRESHRDDLSTFATLVAGLDVALELLAEGPAGAGPIEDARS
ncbi:hypothetical protein [Litorihabitans aurantiacus]|uniref:DUF3137 domain-containing protein n=1 Tax=Litorihabitans aurantiacus TaxID=1930061 RepID=A0AA38CRY8_9MICO|nr:hypothetical protein [Litorihabitans aurantiacus]GMA33233.1 hypothetical protein GCM10025875_32250 [Litorihabitans aurantiacus]